MTHWSKCVFVWPTGHGLFLFLRQGLGASQNGHGLRVERPDRPWSDFNQFLRGKDDLCHVKQKSTGQKIADIVSVLGEGEQGICVSVVLCPAFL